MGAYLSLRLKWANEEENILDAGVVNTRIYNRLFRKLDAVARLQPKEASTAWVRPLKFATTARPGDFDRFGDKADYVKDEQADAVTSVACSDDGRPLFELENLDDVMYVAYVHNIEQLVKHLKHFESIEERNTEIREILQDNREPLFNISGMGGSPEQVLSKSYEQVQQLMDIITQTSKNPQKENSVALANARKIFELLLVLNRLDNKLLAGHQRQGESGGRNSMQSIENELRLLQSFCGHEPKYCLVAINWESEFKFANGTRAPPWRQALGELCYIVVGTHDVGKLVLTCFTDGVFVNKGYFIDESGVERLDYDRASDIFPTITSCLRTESPHFAAHVDNQEHTFVEPDQMDSDSDLSDDDLEVDEDGGNNDLVPDDYDGGAGGASGAALSPAGGDRERAESTRSRVESAASRGDEEHAQPSRTPVQETPASPARPTRERPAGTQRSTNATRRMGGTQRASSSASRRAKSSHGSKPLQLSSKWGNLGLDPNNTTTSLNGTSRSMGSTTRVAPKANRTYVRKSKMADKKTKRKPADRDESSSDEEYEDEILLERSVDKSDISPDYTQINKLVKFLKTGTQRATIIALVALRDFNLKDVKNQLAVKDVGGLEPLINLLHSNGNDPKDPSVKLRLGSAILLRDVALNSQIQIAIAQLDGIRPLVDMLKDKGQERNDAAKCLAAETLANLAQNARNRSLIRREGGIRALVNLVKDKEKKSRADVFRSAALALWACCKNDKNKVAVRNAGGIPHLVRLLDSNSDQLIIPVAGVLEELGTDRLNREEIRETDKAVNPPGAVRMLVAHLSSPKIEVSTQAAAAIYKLAEDEGVRNLVHEYRGLETLARLLESAPDPKTINAVTGAIWKLAASSENALVFHQLEIIPRLVSLVNSGNEEVEINVAGALWNCAKVATNRAAIRATGGIQNLVGLLTSTNHALLINVTGALWACALDTQNMQIICQNDGLRLLWSLLKSSNPKVQANAAGAISPCMDDATNVADVGRSFVGALSIMIGLLSSEDDDVQANVCAAIAKIAKDQENLAVITEDGVLPLLAKLTVTKSDNVRKKLAYAICRCCPYGRNRETFGKLGAVLPLVDFLKSTDPEVHQTTAMALNELSNYPANSIVMWNAGAVPLLMHLISSEDEILQEAAASTVSNIRRFSKMTL